MKVASLHRIVSHMLVPDVGPVVTAVGEVTGVVQGLDGLALAGNTLQVPTLNSTSSMAMSPW